MDITQQIKKVVELDDPEDANTYIELGWVLLGVHQHIRLQVGMTRAGTIYVMGHTTSNPPTPDMRFDLDALMGDSHD